METTIPPLPRTFPPSPTVAPPKRTILTEMLFLLRSLQQSTLSIALFIALYFVYWHYTLIDNIPLGLVAFTFTAATTQLASYLTSLSHTLFPTITSPIPLKITILTTLLLTIGYISLHNSIGGFRGGDDWFKPIRENKGYSSLKPAGVEEHHAVLRWCLLVLGGVGMGAGWALGLVAFRERKGTVMRMEALSWRRMGMGRGGGYKVLGSGEEVMFGGEDGEERGLEEGSLKSLRGGREGNIGLLN